MRRRLPLLLGLAVLVATGAVHGLWTDRWSQSPELTLAVARMADLPDDLGDWRGTPVEQEQAALTMAGASGYWGRSFVRDGTGELVYALLLCGRPGQMSVHRPEHCYKAAGFDMAADPVHIEIPDGRDRPAQLWTALFRKDEASGPSRLRIFWTWSAGDSWSAPTNPRWAFAPYRALYKLYVIRPVVAERGPLEQDASVDFLRLLLPELTRRLQL